MNSIKIFGIVLGLVFVSSQVSAGNLRLQLTSLQEKIRASEKAGTSQAVRDLPLWLPHGKQVWAGPKGARVRPEALRLLAAPREEAWLKALAAFWWVQYGDRKQLEPLAGLLDDASSVGRLPSLIFSQRVAPPLVQWRESSLGQVASLCLERMIGLRFSSRASFDRWHGMNRNWGSSPDLQRAELLRLMLAGDEEGLSQRLRSLEKKPELYVRTLLFGEHQGQPFWMLDAFPLGDAQMTGFVKAKLGPAKLLALLQKDKTWPEFEGKDSRYHFYRRWVLDRAEILFSSREAPIFWRMAEGALKRGKVEARLVIAAARLSPRRGRDLLQKALSMSDQVFERTRLLEAMVMRYMPGIWPQILKHFFSKLGADLDHIPNDCQAIIRALGSRRDGANFLAELARDTRIEGIPVLDLFDMVKALHKRDEGFGCRLASDFRLMFSKKYRGMRSGTAELKQADEKIEKARVMCLGRVQQWGRDRKKHKKAK